MLLLEAVPAQAASLGDASPDSTLPPPPSLVRALGRIQPASTIRVEASAPPRLLEGMLDRWDDHSLQLRESTGSEEIPLSSVQGLWVRGRATGHGAKIGAISLGIVGAVAGVLGAELGSEGGFEGGGNPATGGELVLGGLVGAAAGVAVGALVGAGVGAAFPRWNQRFP